METETAPGSAGEHKRPANGKKHKAHGATMASTTAATITDVKGKDADKEAADGAAKEKQKRIAACDVCRLRKVKCVKLDGEPRCNGCVDLNRECTYEYMPKKPGPPNPHARPSLPHHMSSSDRYAPYPPITQTYPPHGMDPIRQGMPPYPPPAGVPYTSPMRATAHLAMGNNDEHMGMGGMPPMDRHPDSFRHPHHLPPRQPPRHNEPPMHHYPDPRHSMHHRSYGGPDLGTMLAPPAQAHPHPHMSTGHSLPPPDGHAQTMHPPHVAASSPSLSGASGYSPNNPPTNGSNPVEHPSDKSNPLSGLMNPPPQGHTYDRPSHPPETASSLGLNPLEDYYFMPWICSTPGGNGEVAPTTPNLAVGNGNGNTYSANQHQIPRALLPGDLTAPVPTSSNLWQHSLAAVQGGSTWSSGLHGPSSLNAAPPTLDMGLSAARQEADDLPGRETYASHQAVAVPAAMTESRPRQGRGARESVTSASDRDTFQRRSSEVDIEEIVTWSDVLCFLSLYHEHLYPLLPLMHWPSFSQLLISRHDKQDIVFRCFLLSLVAYSILQLPKSVIPKQFTQEELVALHRRCHQTSRRMQTRVYDPLELNHISTLYCDHIYLGSTGKDNAANVVLAEAMRLAITLGLHDENVAEQQGLDAIERDCRRRVFWILYGSDRTIAALISCPMLLSDDDIDVGDILECDDSLITAAGAFPQPANKTPILSGFIHVTRIFRLLSRVLRCVRAKAKADGRDGISSERGYERFPDPRSLIESLQALLDGLPAPLRLQSKSTEHRSKAEAQAFDTCKANILVSQAFDTCKANILVSQVLVRFAIYQYAMLQTQSTGQAETCLTELTDDVLRRLHEMSSESLAANGESIRHKVLFIASSLLNKYPTDNASADHVAEFLAVYNKILTNQNKLGTDAERPEDEWSGED